jgi:exopolysaccharide biosynthesis polyprenyl glycosylphosphotransferase
MHGSFEQVTNGAEASEARGLEHGGLRLVAPGGPEVPLGLDLGAHPARRAAAPRSSRARRALPGLDLLCTALFGAVVLREPLAIAAYALAAVPSVAALEGYGRAALGEGETVRSLVRLMLGAIVCGWCASMVTSAGGFALTPTVAAILFTVTTLGWAANRQFVRRCERRRPERVLVLGGGSVAARVFDIVKRQESGRLELLGFLDDEPQPDLDERHLGSISRLKPLIVSDSVDRVIVAFSHRPDTCLVELLRGCDELGVRVDVVPRLFDLLGPQATSYQLGGLPLMSVAGRGGRSVQRFAKRALDVIGAFVLLLLASPLLALIAIAIRLQDGGPILFIQQRVGYRGGLFHILKFRSMIVDADRHDAGTRAAVTRGGIPIEDAVAAIKTDHDSRVTRIGAFIRRSSLDELPQLWNVLRGDMSLVGPRPLREFEAQALEDWALTRQLERPGITGLWQVSGRSHVQWSERMQLDYAYVRHWSLGEDLEILAKTVPAVIAGDGAR